MLGQGELVAAGAGVHSLAFSLPTGFVADPSATSVRCTEAELQNLLVGCPDASQVGMVIGYSTGEGGSEPSPIPSQLYNMVPPAGVPAEFAFDINNTGTFVHIDGGVSPRDGVYRLSSTTEGIISLLAHPVLDIKTILWGDPSAAGHDALRGDCLTSNSGALCPVPHRTTPFLTMPTSCPGSLSIDAVADSWANPGESHAISAPASDLSGDLTSVTGCNQLDFAPTLEARPTTTVADSPSGLSVDLGIPQTSDLGQYATAHLRKAVVTLPEGLVLNPSSANGLDACASSQIGIDPSTGMPDDSKPSCPDASRVGSVEVDTPLLPDPLSGSVFIAKPYDNPFSSLLAIYVVIDDPETNVLVKFAGHVAADPDTGQLVTTFDENPQLPFSHFKLDLKAGPHSVLRTPATCGSYSTTSELTPWSAPDSGPPATPRDDYLISQGPNGACATTLLQQPNSPFFDAGSASAIAAAKTPFVLHLRRGDATQTFSALTISPPPGLIARLAGVESCPDSALAAAELRSGVEEKGDPSCPSKSQVGSFVAGSGAGPSPYYVPGKVYLTGPYKGAPLSLAFIAPAVAGPYDIGTTVTRAAVYVDSQSARVTAVSDPLPEILKGIPLDVRSLDISLDRPDFTRNGTSCDPFSVDGHLVSSLGQSASLLSRFQLGECARLAFKPKLAIRLKGATKRGKNPALIATLTAKDGEANIASTAVTLPRSAFLDQSHIKTVCTRVQFAAGQGNGAECPQGSIYGAASARSPLFDYALTGKAYLRSSSHKLPDLVIALNGPPSQPIAIELAGRTDSVKGALRNTFEAVPDAPVSSFRLELFGGKRGLVVNSRNLCAHDYRATVELNAQNGALLSATPKIWTGCSKVKRKQRKRHRHA